MSMYKVVLNSQAFMQNHFTACQVFLYGSHFSVVHMISSSGAYIHFLRGLACFPPRPIVSGWGWLGGKSLPVCCDVGRAKLCKTGLGLKTANINPLLECIVQVVKTEWAIRTDSVSKYCFAYMVSGQSHVCEKNTLSPINTTQFSAWPVTP